MSSTNKQLFRFIITGFFVVTVDFICYFLLIKTLSYDLSKFISFIVGTFFAFLVNKFWTFEKNKIMMDEIFKFFIVYGLSLFINVYVNSVIIDFSQLIFLAFLISTGCSATCNFLGQKFWVFK